MMKNLSSLILEATRWLIFGILEKAAKRLVFGILGLFILWMTFVLLTIVFVTSTYPEEANFESWLKTSWEHTTVYNGKMQTLYFYMDNDAWNSGREEWQKGALKRLGCAAVLEFPEDNITPPYHTELYVSAPLPGGPPHLFSSLIIVDEKSCTKDEKLPLTSDPTL